jgi:ubiquitin C-terminal hydrolase
MLVCFSRVDWKVSINTSMSKNLYMFFVSATTFFCVCAFSCRRCRRSQNATKCVALATLPRLLCLHLKVLSLFLFCFFGRLFAKLSFTAISMVTKFTHASKGNVFVLNNNAIGIFLTRYR